MLTDVYMSMVGKSLVFNLFIVDDCCPNIYINRYETISVSVTTTTTTTIATIVVVVVATGMYVHTNSRTSPNILFVLPLAQSSFDDRSIRYVNLFL